MHHKNQQYYVTQEAVDAEEISTEQKKDSICITEIPEDSILIAQIILPSHLKILYRALKCMPETDLNMITFRLKKKIVPSGHIVESFSYGGAPCENFQISSFDKMVRLYTPYLFCLDVIASNSEGCAPIKSVHWFDSTHFYIKRRAEVIVLEYK